MANILKGKVLIKIVYYYMGDTILLVKKLNNSFFWLGDVMISFLALGTNTCGALK